MSENVVWHLDKIAVQAGLEVMGATNGGVLGILYNRESVPDATLLALTADDVTDLYESLIAPAIDRIEERVLA